jgi:hypothetical protein
MGCERLDAEFLVAELDRVTADRFRSERDNALARAETAIGELRRIEALSEVAQCLYDGDVAGAVETALEEISAERDAAIASRNAWAEKATKLSNESSVTPGDETGARASRLAEIRRRADDPGCIYEDDIWFLLAELDRESLRENRSRERAEDYKREAMRLYEALRNAEADRDEWKGSGLVWRDERDEAMAERDAARASRNTWLNIARRLGMASDEPEPKP